MAVTPYVFREASPEALETSINAVLGTLLSERVLGVEVDAIQITPAYAKNIAVAMTTDTAGASVLSNPYVFKTFAAAEDSSAQRLALNFMAANPTYFFSPIYLVYRPAVTDPNQSTIVALIYNVDLAEGESNWGYEGSGSGGGGALGTSVKLFGATGDGITDDTDAIQATIDYVHNVLGGGAVLYPHGTYIIRVAQTANAAWRHCLTVYEGITMRGESRERSTIKIMNNAGNYISIFARALISDTDLNDFAIESLGIDQNTDNNYPSSMSALTNSGARAVVICFGGHRLSIKNAQFSGIKSINTLIFNGPVGFVQDVQVTGNRFDMAVSATINNDHSTIYTSASEVVIAGNQFRSPSKNTYGATTAIETHGSKHVVYGNEIVDYLIGMNITGVAYRSDNVIVTGNSIAGGRYGIQLWSYFAGGNTTEPAITNLVISNNTIRIDRDPWTMSLQTSFGIGFDTVGHAPVRGVKIVDNLVFFEVTSIGIAQDNLSGGVSWVRGTITPIGGIGYDEDVTISDNSIINAIGPGIDLRGPINGLRCEQNNIINPARSTYGPLAGSFRSGILIFPSVAQTDWVVSRNRLYDDQATPTMVQGVYLGPLAATNCRLEDNIWTCVNKVNGVNYPVIHGFVAGSSWYQKWTIPNYSVSFGLVGNTRAGSSVLDPQTGTSYVQTTAPEGVTYVAEISTSYPPYTVPWGKVDGSGALDKSEELRFIPPGNALVVGNVSSGEVWANGPVSGAQGFRLTSGGTTRGRFFTDGPESGSDAGGNPSLALYSDAGGFLGYAFIAQRATGRPFRFIRPLQVDGGLSPRQAGFAADAVLTIADVLVVYSGSGNHTLTAPAANALGATVTWTQLVTNQGTGPVSYTRSGSDTINGNTSPYVLWPGESAVFCGNGTSNIAVFSMGGSQNRIITRTAVSVDLNSAATDVATVDRLPGLYRVRRVTVTNASVSLTTATYSLRTAPGGGGVAIVNDQALTTLVTPGNVTESIIASTDLTGATALIIRNNTPQGAPATATFVIELESVFGATP